MGKSDSGEFLSVYTDQIGEGEFDFIQTIWDSEYDEKIYGLGLQYTETNFKGSLVHIISSEGGVGRGL